MNPNTPLIWELMRAQAAAAAATAAADAATANAAAANPMGQG